MSVISIYIQEHETFKPDPFWLMAVFILWLLTLSDFSHQQANCLFGNPLIRLKVKSCIEVKAERFLPSGFLYFDALYELRMLHLLFQINLSFWKEWIASDTSNITSGSCLDE